MTSRTVWQNLISGIVAGTFALAIYSSIAAFFHGGLSGSIISTGFIYGIVTLIITFLISFAISTWKAKS